MHLKERSLFDALSVILHTSYLYEQHFVIHTHRNLARGINTQDLIHIKVSAALIIVRFQIRRGQLTLGLQQNLNNNDK